MYDELILLASAFDPEYKDNKLVSLTASATALEI